MHLFAAYVRYTIKMDVSGLNEKNLVEKAKTDSSAFGELYELHYARIFGYVLRRTANLYQAQDVTSEVFFKALKGLKSFNWNGTPFSAWLYRIASHEIVNNCRHNSRYSYEISLNGLESIAPVENVLQHERDVEESLDLQSSFLKLPAKYQEIIALRYFEDMEISQIAAITGKSENTVKSLIFRGISCLKELNEKSM